MRAITFSGRPANWDVSNTALVECSVILTRDNIHVYDYAYYFKCCNNIIVDLRGVGRISVKGR